MATFPANPVVGTTTATLGSTNYLLTARGWERQGAGGSPGAIGDVFDAISASRGYHPGKYLTSLDDEMGEGEFSTENHVIAAHTPGPGPFSLYALWGDPTDGTDFVRVHDSNGVWGWVQAN